MLRLLLALIPTEKLHRLDDWATWQVLTLVRSAADVSQGLSAEVGAVEAARKRWNRVEAFGKSEEECTSIALAEAMHEVSWISETCLSRLILLSTMRDNNTGMYRHPMLARKFPPEIVSRALARVHKEACDELLQYPFGELVGELEHYVDQTGAQRSNVLANWKKTKAYRSAKPTDIDPFSALCLDLTFDVAVAVLDSRAG
jgi:hypothetical protein